MIISTGTEKLFALSQRFLIKILSKLNFHTPSGFLCRNLRKEIIREYSHQN